MVFVSAEAAGNVRSRFQDGSARVQTETVARGSARSALIVADGSGQDRGAGAPANSFDRRALCHAEGAIDFLALLVGTDLADEADCRRFADGTWWVEAQVDTQAS